MSSEQYLIDAASRHAVFVQRYSKQIERVAGSRIASIIEELLDLIVELDIDSVQRLEVEVASRGYELYTQLELDIFQDLIDFAQNEAEFSLELLNKATDAPKITPADFAGIVNAMEREPIDVAPGIQTTIRQSLSQFSTAKIAQVNQVLRDTFVEGKTQNDTVKALRGIIPLQRSQIASLVRTANNASSTMAAFKTFEANLDILIGYKWVSTLDMNTTLICMARDGKVYPFLPNSPTPPAHWGCRSVIIPKVDPKYDLGADVDGDRPSVGADGAEEVSTRVTYGGWLRKQPRSFVESALGKTRAKLFLSGQISIEGFTDPTGREYSLAELGATNGEALR